MTKPKLNDPDVEITTTTTGESITIHQTIPSKQFKDIFVTGTSVKEYTPTLEEVKKEWEALRYKWFENDYKIELITTINDFVKEIYLDKIDKNYCCFDGGTEEEYVSITIQEHQLLTKTFRALGWFDEK